MLQNGVFNVVPVGDWYNFKPKRTYQTFSTEEAEIMVCEIKIRIKLSHIN
jgi:hypothetical protein